MENTKKQVKCWHYIFLITNGLNFIYSIFLLSVFSYFVAKNEFKDSFTISTILFFIFYALICVIGQLWTKKSLCLNYIYMFFMFFIYFAFFFFEWTILIDVDTLKDYLVGMFKNSESSSNALIDIFRKDLDNYKIGILVNTGFFVYNF